MDLDKAFDLLRHIYTQSQKRDLHVDPEVIEAFRVVVAAHPEARPELEAYWRAMAFQPGLTFHEALGEVQACHPIMRGLFRKCRRPGY